jgi:hypothetical protein
VGNRSSRRYGSAGETRPQKGDACGGRASRSGSSGGSHHLQNEEALTMVLNRVRAVEIRVQTIIRTRCSAGEGARWTGGYASSTGVTTDRRLLSTMGTGCQSHIRHESSCRPYPHHNPQSPCHRDDQRGSGSARSVLRGTADRVCPLMRQCSDHPGWTGTSGRFTGAHTHFPCSSSSDALFLRTGPVVVPPSPGLLRPRGPFRTEAMRIEAPQARPDGRLTPVG